MDYQEEYNTCRSEYKELQEQYNELKELHESNSNFVKNYGFIIVILVIVGIIGLASFISSLKNK